MNALLLLLLLAPSTALADDPPIQVVQPNQRITAHVRSFLVPESRYDQMIACLVAQPQVEADLALCVTQSRAALDSAEVALLAAQDTLSGCRKDLEICTVDRISLQEQTDRLRKQRNLSLLAAGGVSLLLGGVIALEIAL